MKCNTKTTPCPLSAQHTHGICLLVLKNRRARQWGKEEEGQRTFIPYATSQDCLLLAPSLPRAGKGISDAALQHITQSQNFQVKESPRDRLSRSCSELPRTFSTGFSLQVGVEGCSAPSFLLQLHRAISTSAQLPSHNKLQAAASSLQALM